LKESDTLRRFMFEKFNIRGAFVHLDATWRAPLDLKDYPEVVRDQLGQCMAAGALLSSTIKYNGSMIMQIQSEGPLKLLVVESTGDHTMRSTAKWDGDVTPGNLEHVFGKGRVVFTVDSETAKDRYQGIIDLKGENVAETLETYFRQSEQLETRFWLAANGKSAAGFLIQKMPGSGDDDQEAWNRAQILSATLTDKELLGLSAEEILKRLYVEDEIRLFESEPLSFRCSCTRERVSNVLRSLGIDEVHKIIEEEGDVSVTCEYCNQKYSFDSVDAEALFASHVPPNTSATKH